MTRSEILGAKEVADYLRLHLFTVHRLAREGKLPGFKIGSDWRFRRSSIEDWIKKREKLNKSLKEKHNSPEE